MSLMPFFIIWIVLASAVMALALMRKSVAAKEDDTIRLASGEEAAMSDQVAIAKRLETIDKWGKLLTILAVALGAVLGAIYCWQLWNSSMTAGVK